MLPLFVPLGIVRRQRRWPYVTWSLVAINTLLYLYALGLGEDGYTNFVLYYGFVPQHPSVLAVFTSQFLHGGFLHLFGNMLFLIVFGPAAEDALGPALYLGFYLAGGVAAAFLHAMLGAASGANPAEPMIGASGAIAALMGLAVLRFHRYPVKVWYFFLLWVMIVPRIFTGVVRLPCALAAGAWGAMELLPAVGGLVWPQTADPVAHWAHIGGFGLGMLVCLAFGLAHEGSEEYTLEEAEKAPLTNFPQIAALVERQPKNAGAWTLYARSRWKSGHAEDSREAFLRAIPLYLEQGKPAEAVAAYRECVSHFRATSLPADLLNPLAPAAEQLGAWDVAYQAYALLARLVPEGEPNALALLRAGRIALERRQDPHAAVQWLSALLRRHPGSDLAQVAAALLKRAEQEAALAPPPAPPPGQVPRVMVPPPPPPPPPPG